MFFYKPKVSAERFQELKELAGFRRDLQRFLDTYPVGQFIDPSWVRIMSNYLQLNAGLVLGGYYSENKKIGENKTFNQKSWKVREYREKMQDLHRKIQDYFQDNKTINLEIQNA